MAYSMSCTNGHFEKALVSPQETLLHYHAGMKKFKSRITVKKCIPMGIALSNSFRTAFNSELKIVENKSLAALPFLCVWVGIQKEKTTQAAI